MSTFLTDAVSLFNAATGVGPGADEPSDWFIVVSRQGGIRMVADPGATLHSLRQEHSPDRIYHLSRTRRGVRLEGHQGNQRCLLEQSTPARRTSERLFSSVFHRIETAGLAGALPGGCSLAGVLSEGSSPLF